MTINKLYICEKPSQARDIAKILGCHGKQDGYLKHGDTVVTWCFGHLLQTAPPDYYCDKIKPWRMEILPIVPDKWHMSTKKESSKQVKVIKSLLKDAETVIIATDADREGEVIARELLDFCKFKGEIKRLWLSALDDASIKKALADIRDGKMTENLYYAGLGRQRADWLIGMNMTMASTVLFGRYGEGVLSVGRVQTPTLKLIVDRDHAIDVFTSKEYFELISQFTTDNQETFSAKWQPQEKDVDEEGRVLNKNIIETIADKIRGQDAVIQKFEDKEKKQAAPLCLSLSQLQKLASSRFNYSAKETLEIAQSLYETHKAITYPRTDCGHLPESQFVDASAILAQVKEIHPKLADLIDACDVHHKSPAWNDKKITAHHAMIPTANHHVALSRMKEPEQKLYDLVCRYYVAQFLGNYEYAERSVELQCKQELFKTASQTPLKAGWKRALMNVIDKEEKGDEVPSAIPALKVNETVKQSSEELLAKNTKPPARFTEGTLIEAMESIGKTVQNEKYKKILKETAGIGTEATRAAIIETLFKRGYIEKKTKQISATEKGKKIIVHLPPLACDPVLTAEWEQALDQVGEGKLTLKIFIEQQKELLKKMFSAIQPSHQTTVDTKISSSETKDYACPQCQRLLIRRQVAKDQRYFWGCKGYPVCRFTTGDQNGSPLHHLAKGANNAD